MILMCSASFLRALVCFEQHQVHGCLEAARLSNQPRPRRVVNVDKMTALHAKGESWRAPSQTAWELECHIVPCVSANIPGGSLKTTQSQYAPDYLRRYSKDHLLYEIAMLFQFGRLLSGGIAAQSPEVATILRNGSIEVFVLHLRNILDFFYSPPRKTDIAAMMFYDSAKLPSGFPHKSKTLDKAHWRAHKEMSHLTTERLWEGDPKKAWNFPQLMNEIKPLVEKFIETASHSRLHPDFIRQMELLLGLYVPKTLGSVEQEQN